MIEEGFPAATTRGEVEVEAAGVATLEMEAEAAGMVQEVGTVNKAEEKVEAAERELEEAAARNAEVGKQAEAAAAAVVAATAEVFAAANTLRGCC